MLAFPNSRSRFSDVWSRAVQEASPDPQGAVGQLMAYIAEFFGCEQIDNARVRNCASFVFDLTPLGFSGMGWNVLIVSHPPENDDEARWQADFLAEQKQAADSIGFCFHLYLSDDRPRRNPYVPSSQDAVFFCRHDLEAIFASPIPKMALAAAIRRQTSVSRQCPFNTSQEASGAMFYGRRSELALLVEELKKSVAIHGARRLGKTSLLRQACRILRGRFATDRSPRAFYFNCVNWSNYAFATSQLAHQIDPKRELRLDKGGKNVEYMLERCSRNGTRPLYLFLDEVDKLIDFDALNGWRFFSLLASAKGAGYIRIVLAGYRSISRLVYGQVAPRALEPTHARDAATSVETPLLLALEPMRLSPLERRDADALLADPLKFTDVQICQEQQVLDRVWQATIGHPFLTQFIGQQFFRMAVDRNPYAISPDDVTVVEQGADLREFLETHFLESTAHNGTPVPTERACGFIFAHSDSKEWTEQDFWECCDKHGIPLGRDPAGIVHRALKNLTDAQILTPSHGRLSFAFPMMRQVLVNAYPDVSKGLRALGAVGL